MRALVISNLQATVWLCILGFKFVLLSLLFFRRVHRQFPAFVVYVALSFAQDAILIWVAWFYYRTPYFFTFWGLRSLELIALFAMVAELYAKIFGSVESMAAFPKIVIRFGAAAGTTVCIGVALDLVTGNGSVLRPFLQLEKGATAAAFTLIGLIVVVAWFYGLPWFSRQISIALGLTFDFGVRAILDEVAAFHRGAYYDLLQSYLFASMFIALTIWMVAFNRSEEPKCALSEVDLEGIEMTLQQLGRALGLVNRRLPG